jgi:hypothetical protein
MVLGKQAFARRKNKITTPLLVSPGQIVSFYLFSGNVMYTTKNHFFDRTYNTISNTISPCSMRYSTTQIT